MIVVTLLYTSGASAMEMWMCCILYQYIYWLLCLEWSTIPPQRLEDNNSDLDKWMKTLSFTVVDNKVGSFESDGVVLDSWLCPRCCSDLACRVDIMLRCNIPLVSLLLFHLLSHLLFLSSSAYIFLKILSHLLLLVYHSLSLSPTQPPPRFFSIYGPEFVPGYNGADYRKQTDAAPQLKKELDASSWTLPTRLTACSGRLKTRKSSCE